MLKKTLINYIFFFALLLTSCEDFYNFEANKLNKKANILIEESKETSDTKKRIELLSNALLKIEKIQRRYPKTKVARTHRKEKKINLINKEIDNLIVLASKEKLENEKQSVISKIKQSITITTTYIVLSVL